MAIAWGASNGYKSTEGTASTILAAVRAARKFVRCELKGEGRISIYEDGVEIREDHCDNFTNFVWKSWYLQPVPDKGGKLDRHEPLPTDKGRAKENEVKNTKLENTIAKMRETMSDSKIVAHIKNSNVEIFSDRQHYPKGVFVYENSPAGGVLVGKRN